MANHYHQLSLKDTFSGCKDMFMDDVPSFFQLLEQHFDISLFIPQTFYNAFYQRLGRKRDYPLTGFLSALILQKILLHRSQRTHLLYIRKPGFPYVPRYSKGFRRMGFPLQNQDNCGTCHRPSENQHVCCRKEIQEPHNHKSRCVSCRNCKPAYCYRFTQYELSTIHPKFETFHCLKKYSIVIVHS